MDRAQIIRQVHDVLAEGFEVDPMKLQDGAHLYHDLGIDSLDAIDMLVLLEEKLGQPVNSMEFKNVRQLSDIYDVIERMMAPPASAAPESAAPESVVPPTATPPTSDATP